MKRCLVMTLMMMVGLAGLVQPAHAEQQDEAAIYLWRLINEARANPVQALARFGIDEADVREALGEDQEILDRGLSPLAFNQSLFESAVAHNADMVEHLYYAYDSQDGRTVADRVAETGYGAVTAGESLAVLAFNIFVDPLEAAELIFFTLLKVELNPASTLPKNILAPDFTEVGIAFNALSLQLGKDIPPNIYLAVIDFAEPEVRRPFLVGNVIKDLDGNGLLDADEGVEGLTVAVAPLGSANETVTTTGPFGAYQVELPPGFVRFVVRDGSGNVLDTRSFFALDANRLLDVWLD